jgi:hypothetical protein
MGKFELMGFKKIEKEIPPITLIRGAEFLSVT